MKELIKVLVCVNRWIVWLIFIQVCLVGLEKIPNKIKRYGLWFKSYIDKKIFML